MTNQSHTELAALLPCPFCGHDLCTRRSAYNPKARCITEGCKGAKLPVLNLDQPEDIAAWNTRAAALESPERVQGEAKLRSIGWGTFRANGSLIEIVDTQVEAERYTHEGESFAEVFVSDNCATTKESSK